MMDKRHAENDIYFNNHKNYEGYDDPTAYGAIINVDKQYSDSYSRFKDTLHVIKKICDISGFELESRIVLKDTKNGRVWK